VLKPLQCTVISLTKIRIGICDAGFDKNSSFMANYWQSRVLNEFIVAFSQRLSSTYQV